MLAAILTLTLFGVQDPQPDKPQDPAPIAEPVPVAEEWDDARTKTELKEFSKRIRARSLKDKLEAIAALDAGRNDKLVPPLAAVVLRERAITVRKAAAEALGHQPPKVARPALLRLLESSSLNDTPEVQAELVGALARAGYERKRDWSAISRLFEADYGENRLLLQRNILALVKEQIELEALDLLVRNLGEPIPDNPDDPSNPPAEYWEARWKAWQSWRADVKSTLLTLTGQQFSTSQEARAWLKENRGKLEKR